MFTRKRKRIINWVQYILNFIFKWANLLFTPLLPFQISWAFFQVPLEWLAQWHPICWIILIILIVSCLAYSQSWQKCCTNNILTQPAKSSNFNHATMGFVWWSSQKSLQVGSVSVDLNLKLFWVPPWSKSINDS